MLASSPYQTTNATLLKFNLSKQPQLLSPTNLPHRPISTRKLSRIDRPKATTHPIALPPRPRFPPHGTMLLSNLHNILLPLELRFRLSPRARAPRLLDDGRASTFSAPRLRSWSAYFGHASAYASAPRGGSRPPPYHFLLDYRRAAAAAPVERAEGEPAAEVGAGVDEPEEEQEAAHGAEGDADDCAGGRVGVQAFVGGGDGEDLGLAFGNLEDRGGEGC